jgi:hypothetical protein
MTKAELIKLIEELPNEKYENIIGFTVVGNHKSASGDMNIVSRHNVDLDYEDSYGNNALDVSVVKTIEEAIYMAADFMNKSDELNPKAVIEKAKIFRNKIYSEMDNN